MLKKVTGFVFRGHSYTNHNIILLNILCFCRWQWRIYGEGEPPPQWPQVVVTRDSNIA